MYYLSYITSIIVKIPIVIYFITELTIILHIKYFYNDFLDILFIYNNNQDSKNKTISL
jgi:hypothetical protein